jgi:phage-related protein
VGRRAYGLPTVAFGREGLVWAAGVSASRRHYTQAKSRQNKDGWYRVIYLSRTNDCIHVVHAFEKDSREIPENEKEVARQNLSALTAYLREGKKRAKQKK